MPGCPKCAFIGQSCPSCNPENFEALLKYREQQEQKQTERAEQKKLGKVRVEIVTLLCCHACNLAMRHEPKHAPTHALLSNHAVTATASLQRKKAKANSLASITEEEDDEHEPVKRVGDGGLFGVLVWS